MEPQVKGDNGKNGMEADGREEEGEKCGNCTSSD